MKIHEDHVLSASSTFSSPSIVSFTSLNPQSPRLIGTETLDIESFNSSKATKCISPRKADNSSPSGGMRWNPKQEQIKKLESLYKGGLRTPNSKQIERITTELRRYGRIEGKNIFYWFQNHKARERQKQKRRALLAFSEPSPHHHTTFFKSPKEVDAGRREYIDPSCNRNCGSRGSGIGLNEEEVRGDGTLELFPLHPHG